MQLYLVNKIARADRRFEHSLIFVMRGLIGCFHSIGPYDGAMMLHRCKLRPGDYLLLRSCNKSISDYFGGFSGVS